MDMNEGKAALQSGVETLESAAGHARHGVDRALGSAVHGARYAGHEVNALVRRRPIETALFGAGAACLLAGLAIWLQRRN